MKIVVLGSGTSHGVPVVGCACPVCTSEDPRDKRMRSSVYIEGALGERVLIDAGPEFRLQAIRAGIKRLDAIFLTHSHADHTHGLDDIRPLSRENPVPVYGNRQTIAEMKERFSYVFGSTGASQRGGGKPKLAPLAVDAPVAVGGLRFTPVPVKHGVLDIFGWEVEETAAAAESGTAAAARKASVSFLYLTDTSAIPAPVLARLGGKKRLSRVIVIGALRIRPHETHFSFEEALNTAAAAGMGAAEVYLTHLCHDCGHAEIEEYCRDFKRGKRELEETKIQPAWDGLEILL